MRVRVKERGEDVLEGPMEEWVMDGYGMGGECVRVRVGGEFKKKKRRNRNPKPEQ